MKKMNIENSRSIKENNLGLKMKKLLAVGLVSVNLLFVGVSGASASPPKKWTEEEIQKLIVCVEKLKDKDGKVKWNKGKLEALFPGRSIRAIQSKYMEIKPDDEKMQIFWTEEETQKLITLVETYKGGRVKWKKGELKASFPDRSIRAIQVKYNRIEPNDEKKEAAEKLTEEEKQTLIQYVKEHKNGQGSITWNQNELEALFPGRNIESIKTKYQNEEEKKETKRWTKEEKQALIQYVKEHKNGQGSINWNQNELETLLSSRSITSIKDRYHHKIKPDDEKMQILWTEEEIQKLNVWVEKHKNKDGEVKWNKGELAELFPGRNIQSIQQKYHKIKPDNEKGEAPEKWTEEEIAIVNQYVKNHIILGKVQWKEDELTKLLPNRSIQSIKNRYQEIKPNNEKQKIILRKFWAQEEIDKIDAYIDTCIYKEDCKHEFAWKGALNLFSCIPKSQIKKQFQKRIYQKCQDNFADFKQCIKKNTDESGKISWNKVRAKFPYLIYINLWENYNNSK